MLKELLQQKGSFSLPSLPYDKKELEPHISSITLEYHHGKHHQAYVNNLNHLINNNKFAQMDLVEIILNSYGHEEFVGIYNNAAQVWNHAFFWHSIKPNGGGQPNGNLLRQLESDFGSIERFYEDFAEAAVSQFGSGWAWLVFDGEKLKITKTSNADSPLTSTDKALLTMDVWEHAYYLDYQNRRPEYVKNCILNLINWEFAEQNFAS